MAEMGTYCKAYLLSQMRAFQGWQEQAENAVRLTDPDTGEPTGPRPLDDDSVIFLQTDFVVTDGIFRDENILFDKVTPEWKTFCEQQLAFQIPAECL
jgi:hypothetical protein